MEIWIDVVILLFIPLMMYRGYRRGGILTLMTFFTIFVAFIGASFLANNFAQPVGRLVQPVVKEMITDILEDALKYENIIIEAPTESVESEEGQNSLYSQEYLSMTRAIQILTQSHELDKIEGFVTIAWNTLVLEAKEYTGSVTDGISTVIGFEIARVGIFIMSFLVLFILWLLLTRAINFAFKLPGLSQVNAITGAGIGLFMALLLVYIFAWITNGTIIASDGVARTFLYRFFANNSPLDFIASTYEINLDV